MPRKLPSPIFRVLSDRECGALVKRNHIGRLCFINAGRPDVTPIHYVASREWIFMRSAPGGKMEAFAHSPYVAFEVDEIDDVFDWRSVVVRGTIYMLPDDGTEIERKALTRALRALRSFVPGALTNEDPTPDREIVYGIHIDTMTGRAAEPIRLPSRRRSPRKKAKGAGRAKRSRA